MTIRVGYLRGSRVGSGIGRRRKTGPGLLDPGYPVFIAVEAGRGSVVQDGSRVVNLNFVPDCCEGRHADAAEGRVRES